MDASRHAPHRALQYKAVEGQRVEFVSMDSMEAVDSVAVSKAGVGWTVHFAAAVRNGIDAGILRATPIKGLNLQRSLGHSIGRPQSRAATTVADVILELIRDMVANGDWANASLLPQVFVKAIAPATNESA